MFPRGDRPTRLVVELRGHRKELAGYRLKLGMGKDEKDLAFPTWDGRIRTPRPLSQEFSRPLRPSFACSLY